MSKVLKMVGFTLVGLILLVYVLFLFILPNVVNINDYKVDIQKIISEKTNLNIDFKNAKIITTPLLGAGIKADDISIKLPDNSVLFSAKNIKTRVSIPSLLLMTVKVSCLEVNEPFVNLEIANNLNFKITYIIEEIINQDKEQKLVEGKNVEQSEFKFDPSWIRIKIPNANINDYVVLVNDLDSKHYLKLKGENLRLGYFNGNTAKVKTYAELFSDENKNITAFINIDTYLPKMGTKLDEEDDPAERIDIPFVNPVTMYRNYDLKANLDTKLRVRNYNNNLTTFGHFYVDDITLRVMDLILPVSYFRADTFAHRVNINTDIYPAKEQNINLFGNVFYGKNPKIDLILKTGNIKFNDMLNLVKAFLDSLHINHELNKITAEGFLESNCYIKTNFKNLKSNGYILVKDGGVNVRNIGKVISDVNINIKLDDNIVDVRNSSLLIGNSSLYIDGKVDEKSIADISIKANKISLATLFKAFAPDNLKNQYNFKNGNITFDLNLKGKLVKAIAEIRFALENLDIGNKNLIITDKKLEGHFEINKKDVMGKIGNNNFEVKLPKTNSSFGVPNLDVEIGDNNIIVKENSILLNNNSKLSYSGNIKDYTKLKSMNFETKGNINTNDLVQIIGNEFKTFIHFKGNIPVNLSFNGDKQKQTLFAQVLCDKENFITPVDFQNVAGANTSLQAVIDFKPNRIKIKKTGLFKRNVSVDEKGNEVVSLDEVLGVDGTIEGKRINLIKITMPKPMVGKIFVFPESNFLLKGKAFIFGESSAPRIRGGYEVDNLSIPELMLTLRKSNIDFRGYTAELNIKDLLLNGSDIQLDSVISLLPSKILNIWTTNVKSRYMNVDKLMVVVNKAMAYLPKSPANKQLASKTQANIPVMLKDGTIDFNRIVLGNINLQNTHSNITLDNNIFRLRYLRTNAFDGRMRGNIAMNLVSTLLDIKVQGNGVNVEKALRDLVGMKDSLSGSASFITDISLKGTNLEEQMKSLKGDVDFSVKNGQFGPFGKLENLIIAENIRESQLFQTALGGIVSGLTTIDTTHFTELNGNLNFKDGICHINPITSEGNILSLHIAGDFDLLKNQADMKARARMASLISNVLGPIGAINPASIVGNAANLNIVTAKAFSLFCELIPEDEINAIPSFSNSYVDKSATKFQLVIRGDVAKPLSLIKSFKWLATQSEYDQAENFVESIPEPIEGSEATTIQGVIDEVEAEKKTLRYKTKHMFDKE